MPLLHKFQQHNFLNGFETHNSILDVIPFEPEVMFIGTHNHGWTWNNSDFYYGRGMFMWPAMYNLFHHNKNQLVSQRTTKKAVPTLPQIFETCIKGKFIFADIVKGIAEGIPFIENVVERCVMVNNEYYWCSRKINGRPVGEYSDTHLNNMGNSGSLDDNVDAIIKYINKTRSVKHIYFTFKSGIWLAKKLKAITENIREGVSFCSIFTPTANGFGVLLQPPFHNRLFGLTHCWVWNGLEHQAQINRPGFGHLDHSWLKSKGVDPDNF